MKKIFVVNNCNNIFELLPFFQCLSKCDMWENLTGQNTCFCMNYSLGPRVDPKIRRVLATISWVHPRVALKVGPSQVRVDPNVEESQLCTRHTVPKAKTALLERAAALHVLTSSIFICIAIKLSFIMINLRHLFEFPALSFSFTNTFILINLSNFFVNLIF